MENAERQRLAQRMKPRGEGMAERMTEQLKRYEFDAAALGMPKGDYVLYADVKTVVRDLEAALLQQEKDWWVRVGKFRKALEKANMHGHYSLFQEHFQNEAGRWEALTRPITDSEWEIYSSGDIWRMAHRSALNAIIAARAEVAEGSDTRMTTERGTEATPEIPAQKPTRRQIVFNWLMADDITQTDGWWGGSEAVAQVDELLAALDADSTAALRTCEEERDSALASNELDRRTLFSVVRAIDEEITGRIWLIEGRGCYQWDDIRYQQEFGWAVHALQEKLEPLRKIAGDLKNCPATETGVDSVRKLEADNRVLRERVERLNDALARINTDLTDRELSVFMWACPLQVVRDRFALIIQARAEQPGEPR